MPKFTETRLLTRSDNSIGSLPDGAPEQTRESSKGKLARCQDPECTSQQTGELRRMAARGLCYSCYRRAREAGNETLLIKRRAHGASYARRAALSKKFERQLTLLDSIKSGVVSSLAGKLPPQLLDAFELSLGQEMTKITMVWNEERERRLNFILDMERIEEQGKVPVVVASDEVIRPDGKETSLV